MRIWNQWVAEGHTKRHVGSQRTPMTIVWEDRQTLRSALQNCITISRDISQKMSMLEARPFSLVHCVEVWSSAIYQFSNHYFGFPWQRCIDRDGDSGARNDKDGYRNCTMSSFQTTAGSAWGILRAVYVSGGSEETSFDIDTGTLHLLWRFLQPFDT